MVVQAAFVLRLCLIVLFEVVSTVSDSKKCEQHWSSR